MFLQSLKYTFSSVMDMYIDKRKKMYGFNFYYCLLFFLFSILVSGILVYLFKSIVTFNRLYDYSDPSVLEIFYEPVLFSLWGTLLTGVSVLTFSFYALYYYRAFIKNESDTGTTKFTSVIDSDDWFALIIFICILFFIEVLTFKSVPVGGLTGLLSEYLYYNYGGGLYPLDTAIKAWFISLVDLIKSFIPYILGMLLIVKQSYSDSLKAKLKLIKVTILPLLFLSAVIFAASNYVVYIIAEKVISAFGIIFQHPVPLFLLGFFIFVWMLSLFVYALSGAMLFPVEFALKRQADKPAEISEE